MFSVPVAAGADGDILYEPLLLYDIPMEKHDFFLVDLLLWGLDVVGKVLMG